MQPCSNVSTRRFIVLRLLCPHFLLLCSTYSKIDFRKSKIDFRKSIAKFETELDKPPYNSKGYTPLHPLPSPTPHSTLSSVFVVFFPNTFSESSPATFDQKTETGYLANTSQCGHRNPRSHHQCLIERANERARERERETDRQTDRQTEERGCVERLD